MNIYNKLSPSYDNLYKLNIKTFKDNLGIVGEHDGWFVDFYPSLGIKKNETCDLLFYGQALNGWTAGFDLFKEINDDIINESIFTSNKYFELQNHSPLDWVNVQWSNTTFNLITANEYAKKFYNDDGGYRTCRSFFWNVTKKLTSDYYELNRDNWDWSKKIVWSNLYKIAPDGANPDNFIRNQQFEISAELVRQEIEELKPKYCIMLTNDNWWSPFRNLLASKVLPFDPLLNKIVSFEQYNETKIIVTSRPLFGNSENYVSQLLQLIR